MNKPIVSIAVIIVVLIVGTIFLLQISQSNDNDNDQEYIPTQHQQQQQQRVSNTAVEISSDKWDSVIEEVGILMQKCSVSANEPPCAKSCPVPPFGKNFRPSSHTPNLMGNNCEPWIKRAVILILDRLLTKDMIGVEWGSGSSSLWYLTKLKLLYSIEHDAEWGPRVRDNILALNNPELGEWKLQVIPDDESGPSWTVSPSNNRNYYSYVSAPIPDTLKGTFDLVVVDGRSRMACLRRAVTLLKPQGGLLVLDNSERALYADKMKIVPAWWKVYESDFKPTQTTIWYSSRL
jgi:hypothetical protein